LEYSPQIILYLRCITSAVFFVLEFLKSKNLLVDFCQNFLRSKKTIFKLFFAKKNFLGPVKIFWMERKLPNNHFKRSNMAFCKSQEDAREPDKNSDLARRIFVLGYFFQIQFDLAAKPSSDHPKKLLVLKLTPPSAIRNIAGNQSALSYFRIWYLTGNTPL